MLTAEAVVDVLAGTGGASPVAEVVKLAAVVGEVTAALLSGVATGVVPPPELLTSQGFGGDGMSTVIVERATSGEKGRWALWPPPHTRTQMTNIFPEFGMRRDRM